MQWSEYIYIQKTPSKNRSDGLIYRKNNLKDGVVVVVQLFLQMEFETASSVDELVSGVDGSSVVGGGADTGGKHLSFCLYMFSTLM